VLARPRLYRRLDDASGAAVTWLSGPPGAGKTTLAASYIEARKLRCIWYRLDAGDDAPETFFHYLGLAARRAAPRYRTPLPALTPEHLPMLGIFVSRYFEALCARWPSPAVLVLDNYERLPETSVFHALLVDAAQALPEGVRLMVLSRAAPPPALARLLSTGAVALLDNAEFKLTLAEVRGFSRLRLKKRVTPALIERLHGRTGGWAAGLALLLGARDLEATKLTENTEQPVLFDYFSTEIFEPLDPPTRLLLSKLALLSELTATLATELTGDSKAGVILADLYRRNHFVVRQGEDAYQFHPLFREFLLARASKSFRKEELKRLQSRAAHLLQVSGHLEAAADLLRAASNWEALSALVLTHAPTLAGQARFQTLESWLQALPAPMRDRTPWLRYWFGLCRMSFDPAEARGHFERALRGHQRRGEHEGALLAWAGIVDTALHLGRDFAFLDRWIEEFRSLRGTRPLRREMEDALVVRMFGALALRQPQHPDIDSWCARAQSLLESDGDLQLRLWAGVHLCNYYGWIGDVGRTRQCRDWLLTLARSPDLSPLMLILVRTARRSSRGWWRRTRRAAWRRLGMRSPAPKSRASTSGTTIPPATAPPEP